MSPTPIPDARSEPGPWSRAQWAALAAIGFLVVLVGWYLRQPDVKAGGDDITYFLLGQSLLAGEYRDLFHFGSPPHVKYPPGTPLWLAAVSVTGLGLPAVQLGQLLMLVATAVLAADVLRRLQAPWLGVVAAAGIGWNPALLEYAGIMSSEILFTLLVTLGLWALLRVEQSLDVQRQKVAIAVAILAAAAAFLTRSAGVAMLATVPLVLVVHRRRRAAALAALVGVVLVVGWGAYVTQADDALLTRSYAADMAQEPLDTTPGGSIGRATANLQSYIVTILPGTLGLPGIPDRYLDNLIWTVMLGGGLVLGAVRCARRWSAAPIFIMTYGVVLLAWPWPLDRLAAPLVPVGIALMLLGAAWPTTQAWRILPRGLPLVALTVIFSVGIVNGNLRRAAVIAQCSRVDAWRVPSACAPPREQGLIAAARAARGALPAGSVIATSKESVVFYFSGYQTVSVKELDQSLSSITETMAAGAATHILLSRINPFVEGPIADQVAKSCAELTEAVASDGSAVLLASRAVGQPDACDAIRRVLEWEEAGEEGEKKGEG